MKINSKKLSLLLVNAAFFIVIFSIFGVITYTAVYSKQYERVDRELIKTQDFVQRASNSLERERMPINPRVILIVRDKNGIIGENIHIPEYYRQYEEKLRPGVMNKIFDIRLSEYHFRSLAFPIEAGGKSLTVQLLVNTNPEKEVLNNLISILITGGIVILFLSIGASWYLAEKSMIPIMESWKKQKQFVENASHELRTPLTIIQSRLELLLKEPNARIIDKHELLGPALQETRRMSKMVSDLLTLARADSDATELDKKNVNINELLSRVIEPYRELGEAQGKNVSLEAQDIEIYCDGERLHQLMVILMDNAIKYTDEGDGIAIKAHTREGKCIITVEDQGMGIKVENKDRIFERFYREDKARSRETGGSGLGLSIAKWIVEKHQGSIEAYPNSPKGTIIEIKLPLDKK